MTAREEEKRTAMNHPRTHSRTLGPAAAGLCLGALLWAATPAPAQPAAAAPTKPWDNKITAGVTLSRGNSDAFLATVGAESRRKWERDELFLTAAFGYGETKDPATGDYTKSADYLTASAQWNHLFTPKLYGGLRVDFRHDDVADLDYRFTLSPLLGYYILKTETDLLNVEAGPGFIFERQGGKDSDYVALRFAERYEHKFGDKARFWQMLEYLPQVDDWPRNWIINAEAGIETSITKALSLRLVAQDTYDNEPAPGREKNDFKLIAGLSYSSRF
jgi:putative salt-induced outer membrane protein